MGAVGNFFSSPNFGLGLGAIGTGMDAAGAYRDAQAQNAANQLNALQLENNAEVTRALATQERRFGENDYNDTIRKYSRLQGENRVGYGASGVSVNVGSPAAMLADTAAEGVYEAEKSQYQRNLSAWQMEQEARNYDLSAAASRSNKVNPWLPASRSAIGGLTNMYSTYGNWQKNPVTIGGK